MGAIFITMRVDSTNKSNVKEAFKERVDEDIYEYGHNCYNGTFSTMEGLSLSDKEFTDANEAREYISDNTEKWENALAVTVKEDGKEPFTLIGGWAAT